MAPFVKLADQLGSFAGQLTESGLKGVRIEYAGDVAEMNTAALTSAALAGVLRPLLSDGVNMVSATEVARERGIAVEEIRRGGGGAYQTYMRFGVVTERQERSVAGTVFSDGKPRIDPGQRHQHGGRTDAAHAVHHQRGQARIYRCVSARCLGDADVNVATFQLGP